VRQTGTIVFIAGPDSSLSRKTSIHPNLEQNQAFLTTVHLQAMHAEGRALVVSFPYSHLGTLPQEVPDHLKLHAFSLPSQMNDFLLRLLHVPRQALCRFLPIRLVKPNILPADLSREGGPELRNKVAALSQTCDVTTQLRKGESLQIQTEEAGEEQTLLPPVVNTHRPDVSFRLELEGTLPSIREMDDRDRLDTESTD